MKIIYREIVSAVIESNDSRILMIKENPEYGGTYPDCWHIPGGGRKSNEKNRYALKREVLEEVGINIGKYDVILIDKNQYNCIRKTLENGEKVLAIMHFNDYHVYIDRSHKQINISLSGDILKYRWIKKSNLKEYKMTLTLSKLFFYMGYVYD